MSTPAERRQPIDLNGPEGETLLSHPVAFIMPVDRQAELQHHFDDMLGHVAGLNDDRLLALTGSLILENCLDSLLRPVMPRFNLLDEDRAFSFSTRIQIAKALDLIPRRILASVDVIRQIRNDFAHNLALKTLDQLPQGRWMP